MYNIFRKSIILVAGFCLLFLYSCTTTDLDTDVDPEKESTSIIDIFSDERETLLYVDLKENISLIEGLLNSFSIEGQALNLINTSDELFIGINSDITLGFDAIVRGNFSKWKSELGLFFSFDWKKVKEDNIKYWINKDGLKIYFENDNYIIVSTFDIISIIKNKRSSILDSPTESVLLLMPVVNPSFINEISNGFIKGGIESISVSLDKTEEDYNLVGTLGLESEGKASAFSRLINLFFKLVLSGSDDKNIVEISNTLNVKPINNLVIVDNIKLKENFLIDFINNIILLEGDADK